MQMWWKPLEPCAQLPQQRLGWIPTCSRVHRWPGAGDRKLRGSQPPLCRRQGRARLCPTALLTALKVFAAPHMGFGRWHPPHTEHTSFQQLQLSFAASPLMDHAATPAESCVIPQESLPATAKDWTYWFTLDFSFAPHFHAVHPLS